MSIAGHQGAVLLRIASCAVAALAMSACTPWREVEWREMPAGELLFEDVWGAVVDIVEVDGMAVDPVASDRGLRQLKTRWRTRAMPFRGSVRRRVHAEFEHEEAAGWRVRLQVERQIVENMAGGFEPKEDDWEPDGQDVDMENHLMAKLQLRFFGRLRPETEADRRSFEQTRNRLGS